MLLFQKSQVWLSATISDSLQSPGTPVLGDLLPLLVSMGTALIHIYSLHIVKKNRSKSQKNKYKAEKAFVYKNAVE